MSNATTLSGNLTRDPEIRYTKDGQATATFALAVNRRWQPRGSDNSPPTRWGHRCGSQRRRSPERSAAALTSHHQVVPTCRPTRRSWG